MFFDTRSTTQSHTSHQAGQLKHHKSRTRQVLALTVALSTEFAHMVPAAAAAPLTKPSAQTASQAVGCLIEPDRVADVGSQVIGVVDRVYVERGDVVKAGQPLLSLRADVERANVRVADMRARVDAEVLASKASLDLAEQKQRRAEALVQQNFLSVQSVDQARGETEVARQKHLQAESQRRIWEQERQLADAQLALRMVRSPFAGVVVERYVNQGERVEERPVVRIAAVDPLRVDLLMPTVHYGRLAPGDVVNIQPEFRGAQPAQATVRQVDRVLDSASNSFRVRLSLPNPQGRMPAGLRCKANLPDEPGSAPAPRTPS